MFFNGQITRTIKSYHLKNEAFSKALWQNSQQISSTEYLPASRLLSACLQVRDLESFAKLENQERSSTILPRKTSQFECERCYTSIITLYAAPIRSTAFSVGWRTGFFKLTIFAGKRFLSLLPPPPYFLFCSIIPSPLPPRSIFHSFPFLARQNYQNLVLRSFLL